MSDLPAKTRRAALAVVARDTLAAITKKFDLDVDDRRSQQGHVDAILRASNSVGFGDVLRHLAREELKLVCEALGLDSSGREKELIVQRILGEDEPADAAGVVATDDGGKGFELKAPEANTKKPRAPAAPRSTGGEPTGDYRHEATRKNNPPAGLIDYDKPPAQPKKSYAYDPHLDPQLTWAGKAEHTSFQVDTVSLHIHERVSTQAIMRAVKREDAQRSLFGESNLPESKAIDFYAHDVGWTNRLVLGDSLLVMNSLLEREQMAGKVQCIFMDPPYGVKFNSNFQPLISRRTVLDGDDGSLTREPEQIQAYRDTWTLGVHSYLTYLRDRLLLARELLADTGSIFLQIGDENVHLVRCALDEVFGPDNFCSLISYTKTTTTTGRLLPGTTDFILWYAKDGTQAKYRSLYLDKAIGGVGATKYDQVELPGGERRAMTAEEKADPERALSKGARPYCLDNLTSPRIREARTGFFPVEVDGREFLPKQGEWKTNREGMNRLAAAGRLQAIANSVRYVRFIDDFSVFGLTNAWTDVGGIQSRADPKIYAVQTSTTAIERCLLMTTDPGDLVLDPTCGSGTTAYVAEQWGRRWITCDTSRVALSLARQRLLTAKFPYFRLRSERVKDGFAYKTVPHITLKSIAQNSKLDACTSQAERERAIRSTAEQEVLYDQPEEDKGKVRVSGPFTVEAIPVATLEDTEASPIEQLEPEARRDDITRPGRGGAGLDVGNDYVAYMIDLLKKSGGVHFKGGKNLSLPTLRPVKTPHEWLHAESETGIEGDPRMVAVSFGSRHGPVTPTQVLEAIQQTRGYDLVLFVGFACDPEAGRMIESGAPRRELHFVHAAPDILVGDLLKTQKATKLFTVFGLPDVKVKKLAGGETTVTLAGVDLYDPITGDTSHDDGANVAAWFLDHDYDGRSFCICQAFFPSGKAKNPWENLQKALKGSIDEDKFEALRGTTSIPFKPGKRIAVKVIDDRGNEVVKVVNV